MSGNGVLGVLSEGAAGRRWFRWRAGESVEQLPLPPPQQRPKQAGWRGDGRGEARGLLGSARGHVPGLAARRSPEARLPLCLQHRHGGCAQRGSLPLKGLVLPCLDAAPAALSARQPGARSGTLWGLREALLSLGCLLPGRPSALWPPVAPGEAAPSLSLPRSVHSQTRAPSTRRPGSGPLGQPVPGTSRC